MNGSPTPGGSRSSPVPFPALLEHSLEGICTLTASGEISYVTPAVQRMLGYPEGDVLGRPFGDFVSPDQREQAVAMFDRCLQAPDVPLHGRLRVRHQDHSWRTLQWVMVNRLANPEVSAVTANFSDVTGHHQAASERKRAEVVLRKVEARLRALFDSNVVNIAVADKTGLVIDANDAYLAMVGRSRDELVAGRIARSSITAPPFLQKSADVYDEVQRLGGCEPFEKQYQRPDGTRVWALVGVARLPDGSGGTVSASIDITRQKTVELALIDSERRFSTIFTSSPLSIYMGEVASGRLVEVNPAFCALAGYQRDAMVGRTAEELGLWDDPNLQTSVIRQMANGESVRGVEARLLSQSGTTHHVLLSIDTLQLPEGTDLFVTVLTDVTDRRTLEEQLRQRQKMEAIGRLAGGVAHDFNNLLTAILGFADLVANDATASQSVLREIDEIIRAGRSAAGLTAQLLAFSRRQVMQPRPLSLNESVRNIHAILGRVLGEHIELTVALPTGLHRVSADPVQIEQVLMNLAVNARDAMPGGGRLLIETANVTLDADYVGRHGGSSAGPHVMLSVSDDGTGMTETVRARLFEPFFTTKEQGKGTGLGLSMVYGAIKQMGGSIWVYSELGHGTTFKIYLPTTERIAPRVEAATAPASLSGSETILLVEDQNEVRAIAAQILTRHGYQVLTASRPREALSVALESGTRFDLLLTDVIMPEMSGRDLARMLHASRPLLRTVYMSGYTDEAIVHHGVLDASLAFIQKPFTPQDLLTRVREVLDAEDPPPV